MMVNRTVNDLPTHAYVWWIPAVRGVLAVGFGIVALFRPYAYFETLLALFGAYVLLDGVATSLEAVVGVVGEGSWLPYLLQAVTGIVAGAVALLYPVTTAAVLLGAWGIVSGGWRIVAAFESDPRLDQHRVVLSGAGAVLLGVATLLYPVLRGGYLVLAFVGYAGMFALLQFNMAARTGEQV